jgi:DNA-binding response OmpR family regulator
MRVLVFDDDTAIGRLVVRIATTSGMEAVAVNDAKAFGQCLRTDPPQSCRR